MSTNFLESYLVKIGFQSDEPSFRQFTSVMEKAEKSVATHAGGMTRRILEAQGAIVGAFTSVSAAILGTIDRVAMADQSYRLMGLRMMMTGEQARKMSMITKALGASMEEIVWDPELHARAVEMSTDIDRWTKSLSPGFEGSMRSIRDFRNEFSRLGVAAQFVGMSFVEKLWKDLAPGQAGKDFHDWISSLNIEELATKLETYAKPALEGTWEVAKSLGGAVYEGANAFKNMIGVLSGDSSIVSATLSFDGLAKAIQHVGEGMVLFFDWFAKAERSLGEFASAAALVMAGKYGQAADEFKKAQSDWVGLGDFITQERERKKTSTERFAKGMALGGEDTLTGAALGMMFQRQGEDRDKAIADQVAKYAQDHPADAAMSGHMKALPLLGPRSGAVGGAVAGGLVGGLPGAVVGAVVGGTAGIFNQAIQENGSTETHNLPSWMEKANALGALSAAPGAAITRWIGDKLGKASPESSKPGSSILAPPPGPVRFTAATAAAISRADNADLISKLHEGIAKYEAGNKPNPISERNNNPGNLRSWKGVPTVDGYAKFPTPEAGGAALDAQLQKLVDRHLTLREAIGGKEGVYPGYASAKDHNQPGPYSDFLSKFAGIDPDTPLDQIQKLAPKQLPHAPTIAPTPDGSPIAPISYVLPRASNSPFDRDWQAAYASMDRPVAPSPTVNHNQQSVDLGGVNIFITQPGADEHKVQRAVIEGIRDALFHQTQLDITQLSPAYA